MSKSVNVIFQKQKSVDTTGTIYIRTIEGKEIIKRSLGIKVSVIQWNKYFNPETQRFRENKNFPQYEFYNSKIEEFLTNLKVLGNDLSSVPNEKKSFIKYWEQSLNNYSNHGTRIKHQTVLKKLTKYLSSIKKTDLLFKEISPVFLRQLKNYLTTVKDPKVLSENTVIHYLKIIKLVINQSISDDYYTFIKHPFNGLKFSSLKRTKSVLNENEIESLLFTKIEDQGLSLVRDMFLFQVFSNGMRVSDLFLLRWNNLFNGRLEYNMFKTGTNISIPVNVNMGIILSKRLGREIEYDEIIKDETITFYDEEKKFYEINQKKLNELIKSIQYPKITYNPVVNKYLIDQDQNVKSNMGDVIEYKGYQLDPSNTQLKMLIDLKENLSIKIDKKFIDQLNTQLVEKRNNHGVNFVFPVLSDSLFSDINSQNEFSSLSLQQYKSIKHHTIVYNRKLKSVQELCGIETNITSHVSRHSYTNLLLRLDNVNLYDISQSLGHSSIKITENYLRSGFNIEKIDYLNDSISKKYSRNNTRSK